MTHAELLQLVSEWDSYPDTEGITTGRFHDFLDRLDWFGRTEWHGYIPAEHVASSPSYMTRLARWLSNCGEEQQQKLLLEYALHINFFSHSDFSAFYQSAFVGPITRWIIDQTGLTLNSPNLDDALRNELYRYTWYCPVTDSFKIGDFYHVNRITGINVRPEFRGYQMLDDGSAEAKANIARIATYMAKKHLVRLVLLEDFVGSGSQVAATLRWTLENFPCPVLFVPLIICPPGIEMTATLEREFTDRFSSRPIIRLKPQDLLGPNREGQPFGRGGLAQQLEDLAVDTFPRVAGPAAADPSQAPYSPFGYQDGGSSSYLHQYARQQPPLDSS